MNSSSNGIDGRLIFRVGIALVMVGMLLLFRYSMEWFGVTARLALGATASAALVGAGVLVPRRSYGRLMQGAGVAGGYVTAWAAHGRYDLADSTTAFIQMVLVAAVGLGLAWRERSDILNALGMVGAVAAPLLVGGEFVVPAGEVAYQAALLLLAGLLYARLGWYVTLLVTVVGSGLVVLSMTADAPGPVLAGVAVWWLVGWALPVVGRWFGLAPVSSDVLAVATIPVPVIAWVMVRAVDHRPSVTALVAALLAVIHFAVWLVDREEDESAVQLLAGVGFTALALLVWFDTAVALPMYLLVTCSVAVYGNRVDHRSTTAVGTTVAALALPVWLGLVAHRDGFSVVGAAADLGSVIVVAAAASLMRGPLQRAAALTAYGMSLVWIAAHLGDLDPGFVTAGFAAVGLVALVAGRLRDVFLLTLVGVGTLGLAVVKLIIVDLATADPMLKVALSFGIGVALLAVGYWVGDTSLVSRRHTEPTADEAVDG